MTWTLLIVGAYLIGSIPFGFLLGRARGIDIREHGSRNIGATNVSRVLGQRLGIFCFVLDVGKGAVPVVAAGLVHGLSRKPDVAAFDQRELWLWLAVACASVAGHMASIFLGFRGGKGVATGFGAMLFMWPLLTLPAIGAIIVWYGVLRLTRYVSLASVVGAITLPVAYLLTVIPNDAMEQPLAHTWQHLAHGWPPFAVTTALAVLVVYRHRANIARIRAGEEPRVGGKKRRGKML